MQAHSVDPNGRFPTASNMLKGPAEPKSEAITVGLLGELPKLLIWDLGWASSFGPGLSRSRLEKFPLPGFGPLAAEAGRPSISQQDSVTTTACGCCWRAAAARPRSGEFPEGCLLEMGVFKGSRFKQTCKKARE